MFKRFSLLSLCAAVAVAFAVAPADAKKPPVKPKKAYWYSTGRVPTTSAFAAHVGVSSNKYFDYLKATGGCSFYRALNPISGQTKIKGKSKKFSVDTTATLYSPKLKAQTTVTIKIDGKFKTSNKITGKYTVSDTSGECTAAQMAEHNFSAKARFKQTGG
ncbi:MAG: hypothetical protein WAO61_01655 [Solirubrobacterales bacterium]